MIKKVLIMKILVMMIIADKKNKKYNMKKKLKIKIMLKKMKFMTM